MELLQANECCRGDPAPQANRSVHTVEGGPWGIVLIHSEACDFGARDLLFATVCIQQQKLLLY